MTQSRVSTEQVIELAPAIKRYRAKGLQPIALKPQSKRPICSGWNDNPEQTWKEAPADANIGLLCGEPSNELVVIDIDEPSALPHLFEFSFTELTSRTMVVATSSGFHVYARRAGLRNTTLPDGIGDVRANGGQVVAPPSIHPDGTRYRFVSSTEHIAHLEGLGLRAELGSASDESDAPTQPGGAAGCVEALSIDPASDSLQRRVARLTARQAPAFRRKIRQLRKGTVDDRSGAEFALAKCMAEAGFTLTQIRRLLAAWGSKARERGADYIHRTATRAMRSADKEPGGAGGGEH